MLEILGRCRERIGRLHQRLKEQEADCSWEFDCNIKALMMLEGMSLEIEKMRSLLQQL